MLQRFVTNLALRNSSSLKGWQEIPLTLSWKINRVQNWSNEDLRRHATRTSWFMKVEIGGSGRPMDDWPEFARDRSYCSTFLSVPPLSRAIWTEYYIETSGPPTKIRSDFEQKSRSWRCLPGLTIVKQRSIKANENATYMMPNHVTRWPFDFLLLKIPQE